MSKHEQAHVNLPETNQNQIEWLINNTYLTNKSEIIRLGIRLAYQKHSKDYDGSKLNKSGDTDNETTDDLVQKEKKKLEKKEAQTKAKHEQLKEKRSDLLDKLDAHKFTVDNADNLMVKWQHYEKRGDNVASWKETHSVEHLHDELHGMDQYRPSKEKVLETLQNGGDLIQHSEHKDIDAEPQEIKAVKP